MSPAVPASGAQTTIRFGAHEAVIVEVGGGLREYRVDGVAILDGYDVDRMADGGRGQPLLPWPNRLEDGEYEFDGRRFHLPVDDLAHRNTNHGLTRWRNWSVASRADDRVTMCHVLYPSTGYPFTLGLQIEYVLGVDGLSVRTTATNLGSSRLPFGAGFHPYFTVGTPTVDAAVLQLAADLFLEVNERRLPTGRSVAVAGSEFDFSAAREIGSTVLDHCFGELRRDPDGLVRVHVRNPATAREVVVWMDAGFKYVQLYSGETLAPERRRQSLAIEPMTCPPNAFHTGTDVLVLEPGQVHSVVWGIALTKT